MIYGAMMRLNINVWLRNEMRLWEYSPDAEKKVFAYKLIIALIQIFFVGGLMGGIMALASNLFVQSVKNATAYRLFLEQAFPLHTSFALGGIQIHVLPFFFLLITACFIIAIRRFFQLKDYHGPADTIYAAHNIEGKLDVKAGFVSTLIACVSASGGASVGQYGPLVHFGASMGVLLKRLTGSYVSTDILLGCGVAGAIAAGFNAPLAGIIFAHEAILRHYSLRAIAPISIASITAALVSEWIFGSNLSYQISVGKDNLLVLLPAVLLIGSVFGGVSALYMHTLRQSKAFVDNLSYSPSQLLFVGACLCGIIGAFMPQVLGLGIDTINAMLNGRFSWSFLLLLMGMKFIVTIIGISFGFYGGIFLPAIFIGTALGGAITAILQNFGFDLGVVFLVAGFIAVAAPLFGAPITATLIVLELTTSYDMAVIAIVAAVASCVTSSFLHKGTFFDRQLWDCGIDVLQGRSALGLQETSIRTILRDNFLQFSSRYGVKRAIAEMRAHNVREAYVVDQDKKILGKIDWQILLAATPDQKLSTLAKSEIITLDVNDNIYSAIEASRNFIGESIPILENGYIRGVIIEADLLEAYLRIQSRVRSIENQ